MNIVIRTMVSARMMEVVTVLAETALIVTAPSETTLIETALIVTALVETTLIETALIETALFETTLNETALIETTLIALFETTLNETALIETTLIALVETALNETRSTRRMPQAVPSPTIRTPHLRNAILRTLMKRRLSHSSSSTGDLSIHQRPVPWINRSVEAPTIEN